MEKVARSELTQMHDDIIDSHNFLSLYTRCMQGRIGTVGGPEVKCHCPFSDHPDNKASFCFNTETGLFNCFGCGRKGDIYSFYQQFYNLSFSQAVMRIYQEIDTVDETRKIVKTYDYTNEAGKLLYQVIRYEPKSFAVRVPTEEGWEYSLNGVDRVLYNLPKITKSVKVLWVEGEKDADTLTGLGFTATTTTGGAGNLQHTKSLPDFSGKTVIIIPDKDKAGDIYAQDIISRLSDNASIYILTLPFGKDISDWVASYPSTAQAEKDFTKLLETAEEYVDPTKLKLCSFTDIINSPPLTPLISPFLWQNMRTVLTAPPGVGKSILSLHLAQAVLTGKNLWGVFKVKEKGSVLIVDEENPKPILKDRLSKFNITKTSPLFYLHYQGVKLDNDDRFSRLLTMILQVKPTLIIFDALIRFHTSNENDNSEMAKVMDRFKDILRALPVSVLILHHERKAEGGFLNRTRGAGDILGAVDHQLRLIPEGDSLTLSCGKTRLSYFKPIKLHFQHDSKLVFTGYGDE